MVVSGKDGPLAEIPLTPRQREVIQLLAEGLTTKDIGRRLKRSPRTIDFHRRRIMQRLGLRTLADLTRYALRKRLVTLEGAP